MHDCKAQHIYVWELELAYKLPLPMWATVRSHLCVKTQPPYRGAVLPQSPSAWGTEDAS